MATNKTLLFHYLMNMPQTGAKRPGNNAVPVKGVGTPKMGAMTNAKRKASPASINKVPKGKVKLPKGRGVLVD